MRELGRNIFRNFGTTSSSFLSLMLLFLLFDLYWIGAGTSENFYTDLLSELRMEAFVSEDVPDSTVPLLEADISTIEGVLTTSYISRSQAREELERMIGIDFLVGYDTLNPLPRSFVLSFAAHYLNSPHIEGIASELEAIDGIDDVSFSRRWLAKAETTRTVIRNGGLVLGVLILLAALISSANNIRLMTRARAVGFQQMRLVGAGRLFLAAPFLIEGLLIGGLSAAVGWWLVFLAAGKISFTLFEIVYPSLEDIIVFCLGTALLGLLSGYLGIRRHFQ